MDVVGKHECSKLVLDDRGHDDCLVVGVGHIGPVDLTKHLELLEVSELHDSSLEVDDLSIECVLGVSVSLLGSCVVAPECFEVGFLNLTCGTGDCRPCSCSSEGSDVVLIDSVGPSVGGVCGSNLRSGSNAPVDRVE